MSKIRNQIVRLEKQCLRKIEKDGELVNRLGYYLRCCKSENLYQMIINASEKMSREIATCYFDSSDIEIYRTGLYLKSEIEKINGKALVLNSTNDAFQCFIKDVSNINFSLNCSKMEDMHVSKKFIDNLILPNCHISIAKEVRESTHFIFNLVISNIINSNINHHFIPFIVEHVEKKTPVRVSI
jgi:hypothetical protein